MPLKVPLLDSQVGAASRLHSNMVQWRAAEDALSAVRSSFPDFGSTACLVKAVGINSLYGTNVLAIYRMAEHVRRVFAKIDPAGAGAELVEDLAALPKADGQTRDRRHHSFASKFAHFFVDCERFPIFDSYAVKTVEYHLGRDQYVRNHEHPYQAFLANLDRIRELAGCDWPNQQLDHYLWLAGQYRVWLANRKAPINVEARNLFANPTARDSADLRAMRSRLTGSAPRGSR